jgi:hypothetical protein
MKYPKFKFFEKVIIKEPKIEGFRPSEYYKCFYNGAVGTIIEHYLGDGFSIDVNHADRFYYLVLLEDGQRITIQENFLIKYPNPMEKKIKIKINGKSI